MCMMCAYIIIYSNDCEYFFFLFSVFVTQGEARRKWEEIFVHQTTQTSIESNNFSP